jgi:hypothetical protein
LYTTKASSSPKVLATKRIKEESKCTDLVLWGANLGSTVGSVRFTKQERDMIKLPSFHLSVIVGLILSDGGLSFANKISKNALLRFEQSLSHYMYFNFVFNILSHYCSSYPSYHERTRKGRASFSISLFSRALPCFTELYNIFYVNGVKVIPDNIYALLTPVALAHLIMGDGVNYKGYGLALATESYSIKEIVLLMNVLTIRYNLNCSLHARYGDRYRIYISSKSMAQLRSIVEPHMDRSMLYKINL